MVKKESNPIVMFFKRRAVRIVGIIGLSFVMLYASAFTAIFLDSTLKNPEQIKFVTDPVAMKQCISNNCYFIIGNYNIISWWQIIF